MGDTAQHIRDLELMFERATSATNLEPDLLAIETIVKIIQNNKQFSSFAAQKIKEKVNSNVTKVVLQSLDILDECMTKCSNSFHAEVGKFRFLNELIKLVSPKHMGDVTSKEIQCKILDLLLIWTIQYPQEHKIKEAYDMLIKQGVVHEPPKSIKTEKITHSPSDFDAIPKNLLLSKDPRDIQVANLMIKQMMENDKRRSEIKLKRGLELKKAMDNASLLNDMLNNFKSNETTEDELVTIKDLYHSCQNLIPTISRLAEDIHNNELLGESLKVNDCLLDITKRYSEVVNNTNTIVAPTPQAATLGNDLFTTQPGKMSAPSPQSTLDELNEIFSNNSTPSTTTQLFLSDAQVLLPTPIQTSSQSDLFSPIEPLKPKPLQLIDNMSEDLFKEVLSAARQGSFKKESDKTPLNMLTASVKPQPFKKFDDLDSIVSNLKTDLNCAAETSHPKQCDDDEMIEMRTDDVNFLITDGINEQLLTIESSLNDGVEVSNNPKCDSDEAQRPLSNFQIEIDTITPGNSPPRCIMDDGLKIILHFAEDRPRDDISVIVITTTNHHSIAVTDYQFDASVSKPCKLRLQRASDTNLPGVLPFRPPTKDITQIMLLSNKENVSPKITCIVSYCLENDPDPIKESVTITDLPSN